MSLGKVLLTPDHMGHTIFGQPVLYWELCASSTHPGCALYLAQTGIEIRGCIGGEWVRHIFRNRSKVEIACESTH